MPNSHDIGSALTTATLDNLELASQLGRQDFEDPSIGVLVHERPVKVKDDKLFSGHRAEGVSLGVSCERRAFGSVYHQRQVVKDTRFNIPSTFSFSQCETFVFQAHFDRSSELRIGHSPDTSLVSFLMYGQRFKHFARPA